MTIQERKETIKKLKEMGLTESEINEIMAIDIK